MRKRGPFRNEDFVQLAPSDAPFSALRSPNWMRTRGAKPDTARRQQRKRALQGYLWVTGTPFSLEYPSLRGGFGWHDISWKHHFQV